MGEESLVVWQISMASNSYGMEIWGSKKREKGKSVAEKISKVGDESRRENTGIFSEGEIAAK